VSKYTTVGATIYAPDGKRYAEAASDFTGDSPLEWATRAAARAQVIAAALNTQHHLASLVDETTVPSLLKVQAQ